MFIYDSTSVAFIKKCESFLIQILEEVGIAVKKSRFEINRYLYPIHVVVFEGKELGHFNAPYLQIGLNRKLIYLAKESVVRDILRHELAHYLTFIFYPHALPHGKEFHEICHRFGFPDDVARATMDLEKENETKVGDLESEKILEKVKKLLSLAQSSNSHEAELATLKANQLLLRHNLDYIDRDTGPVYMDRLLARRKKDSKLTAIYSILKHFIVRPVISQGKSICCLEVSGTLTNVKLAGYVATFLDRELDYLWEETKKDHKLQGLRAKNSFFQGIADGFNQKMKQAKTSYSEADQKALVVVEEKLCHDTRLIYKRLGHSSSSHQSDPRANQLGHAKGLKLSIKNALQGAGKILYLTKQ